MYFEPIGPQDQIERNALGHTMTYAVSQLKHAAKGDVPVPQLPIV